MKEQLHGRLHLLPLLQAEEDRRFVFTNLLWGTIVTSAPQLHLETANLTVVGVPG